MIESAERHRDRVIESAKLNIRFRKKLLRYSFGSSAILVVCLATTSIWWSVETRNRTSDFASILETTLGVLTMLFVWALFLSVVWNVTLLIALHRTQRELEFKELDRIMVLGNRDEGEADSNEPWERALAHMEHYWQTNLSQVSSIYNISLGVMILGFVTIATGIVIGFVDSDRVQISYVAGAAGVITEFIGATFLFIYRSTMNQANTNVTTLARIHAIGLSLRVTSDITDEDKKNEVRAAVASRIVPSETQSS